LVKRFITIVVAGTLILSSVSTLAASDKIPDEAKNTVNYVNNQYNNIDYKYEVTDESKIDGIPSANNKTLVKNDTGSKNLEDLDTVKSWLISNDIISRPYKLKDGSVTINEYEDTDYCPQTLLWTMLYKAKNGVIESRPLANKTKRTGEYTIDNSTTEVTTEATTEVTIEATTESTTEGATESAIQNTTESKSETISIEPVDATVVQKSKSKKKTTEATTEVVSYTAKDYDVLVSSNVYELYLKELMDQGMIDKSTFNSKNGKKFLSDYKKLSNKKSDDANVAWDNRLKYGTLKTKNVLGYSTSYNTDFNVTEKKPNYFVNEKMYTIGALQIIAKYVRSTEKDMSNLEASIVTYKYGINYKFTVDDEAAQNDIEFLIAKGILDFENPEEFTNLYGEFTYESALKIIYRVANEDARLNFSEVTLTDGESFWLDQGYYEDNMSIVESTSLPQVKTITDDYWNSLLENDPDEVENSDDEDSTESNIGNNFIDDILGLNFSKVSVMAASEMPTFTVVKMFDLSYDYTYKGINIKELSDSNSKPEEFVSYEESSFNGLSANGKTTLAKVTFKVEAKSYDTAVLYVDNNIAIDGYLTSSDMLAYTTINENGEEITLVPATTLQNSLSNISIIEDKVLMNNVTGAQAIILPEQGYALVGNRVVVSDTLMMTDTSDEVYYNLDVICTLLGNTYLSKLTNKQLYVCSSINNEVTATIKSSSGSTLGKAYVVDFLTSTSKKKTTTKKCFNVDNVNYGVNVLTRKFNITVNGNSEDVYFIVNWDYCVPDETALRDMIDNNVFGTSTLTLNDVNEAIYTKPSDKSLALWWDTNLSISNSLANFMYGTTNVEYVKSGYLTPSLTILRDSTVPDSAINSIFTANGFKLDDTGLKYSGSTTNWWETFYGASLIEDSFVKALALSNRTCNVYNSTELNDGFAYGNSYYVTKAGVIYEDFDSAKSISYDVAKKQILISSRKTGEEVESVADNTVFSYGGSEWIYVGAKTMTNSKGESVLCYKIQPNFVISKYNNVTITKTKYGVLPRFTAITSKQSDTAIYNDNVNELSALYSTYFPTVSPIVKYKDSSEMYGVSSFRIKNFYKSLYDKGSYYVNGTNISTDGKTKVSLTSGKSYKTYSSNNIQAIPYFYVPASNFYFTKVNDQLMMQEGSAVIALTMNNVFTSGISKNVIDNILFKETKTIAVNSMLNGQQLLIDDVLYTKTTDNSGNAIFISEPITDTKFANALKNAEQDDELGIIKSHLFAAQQITCEGVSYYLSSFVIGGTVGDISNAEDGGQTLYKHGGNKYIYVDSTNQTVDASSSTAKSVCIAITLADGLYARPTNEKQNTYILLKASNVTPDSSIDYIPFFNENLTFSENVDSYVSVTNSKFNASSLFLNAKTGYKKMMKEAFQGDVITVIWMIIFYFCVYMTVVVWIMYIILGKGYGLAFFRAATIPSGKNGYLKHGFDLIKIFTFGTYNIDSMPTLARTMITSFITFFISYAIVFWQPF
jgi:hypothetical protein